MQDANKHDPWRQINQGKVNYAASYKAMTFNSKQHKCTVRTDISHTSAW